MDEIDETDERRRPGRRRDEETIDYRMRVWAQLAPTGELVADIAARLRMSRAALNQMVLRERARKNPLAVYHAHYRQPGGGPMPLRARTRQRAAQRAARNAGT